MTLIKMNLLFLVSLCSLVHFGSAITCEKEGLFGFETYITCPPPGRPEEVFCCGNEENRRCCQSPFPELDQETIDNLVESLPKIIGILVGAVLVVLILCVVCCCCCPFCILAKKRKHRGYVQRGATEVTVTVPGQQPAAQPLQPYAQPQAQIQPGGYPGYPPADQQQYPGQPQQYPPQAYPASPPQQPYPGYPAQGGYPAGPVGAAPAPGYPG